MIWTVQKVTCSKEDQFNQPIITLLSGQQNLQTQLLDMMKNMTRQHEYENVMRDINICDGKNIDLADWLLQIEKVAALTNIQEHELVTAKSTETPYKMFKRMGNDLSW